MHFANRMVMEAPRLQEFFEVLDTVPAVRDRPDAVDPGRMRGLVEFKDVSFSYDGKRPAVADLTLHGAARARRSRWSAPPAPASRPRSRCCTACSIRSPAHQDRRHGHPGDHAVGAAPQHRRGVPGGAAVQPLGGREPARRQARRDRGGDARRLRARAGPRRDRAPARRASRPPPASAAGCSRAASASGCRSRARC